MPHTDTERLLTRYLLGEATETEQERIEEDLRGQIAGEVRCDDLFGRFNAGYD